MVVVVFLGVACLLPAVADLRVLTTVEYAVAVAAAVVGVVLLLLSSMLLVRLACPPDDIGFIVAVVAQLAWHLFQRGVFICSVIDCGTAAPPG